MNTTLRPFSLRSAIVLPVAALVLLTGCVSTTAPVVKRSAEPLPEVVSPSPAGNGKEDVIPLKTATGGGSKLMPGTGVVINTQAASAPPPALETSGEATFNFEGESVHAVVKAILGDLLQQNYVIAPSVQGTVTLATPRPVSGAQAMSLLEMVLGWNNARLVWADGRYNVVAADQAIAGNLAPRTGDANQTRGYEVRAVPLKFISASEMEKLIKPYARDKAVVSVDTARNLIVFGGTRAELQNYLRTVEVFDVDWLAGMSVGVFPLQSSEASKLVNELDSLFGESGKTPLAGMFRFMPLEGQNAVLVITPQAKYLGDIQSWIEKMDAGGEGSRLYTYEVSFMKASDLAEQVGSVFGANVSSHSSSSSPSLMPGLDPIDVRTIDTPAADAGSAKARAEFSATSAGGGGGDSTAMGGNGEVSISAIDERNALLVRASPQQWESIRRTLEKLDTMPLQVHVEAQIIEVKLLDQLEYGVSWFFGNAVSPGNLALSNALNRWRNPASSIQSTGSAFTFVGPSAEAIVSTLDELSDLRVMAAPSLMVRNNVQADFSAGTQIPVASTIIDRGVGDPDTGLGNFSQVQFRQTGVSLKVKPRISKDGLVFLEIDQEVSSPAANSPGTPTIGGNVSVDNNKLKTEVAVRSGETIMLAGLIKTEQGTGSSGIPFLSRLPVVGALFGKNTLSSNRSEVLVLITPTLIRDPADARKLTDEYGERFRALEPLRKEAAAHPAPASGQ